MLEIINLRRNNSSGRSCRRTFVRRSSSHDDVFNRFSGQVFVKRDVVNDWNKRAFSEDELQERRRVEGPGDRGDLGRRIMENITPGN